MPDSSDIKLAPGYWSDILNVLTWIKAGSTHGHFSPRMQAHRVRLGIALQLLMVMAVGRLYSPQRVWLEASVQVLYAGQLRLGFTLLTWLPVLPSGQQVAQITLFKVAPGVQSRGLGTCMLRAVLAKVPRRCIVQADCLPASTRMQRLLSRQGFKATGSDEFGARRWVRTIP